jgi:hypothetical protein
MKIISIDETELKEAVVRLNRARSALLNKGHGVFGTPEYKYACTECHATDLLDDAIHSLEKAMNRA